MRRQGPDQPHRPKRSLGQNFLRNDTAAERIVAALEPDPEDLILEIGPGEGVLTGRLLRKPNEVMAIEIDRSLAEQLRVRYEDSRLFVIEGDATDYPLPERTFRAVGNLPYNAGTPIVKRIVASPFCRRAVFMLQKEVADRIVADPGTGAYGYLTVHAQLLASVRILLTLNPGSFFPAPRVRSSVVVFDPRPLRLQSDAAAVVALASVSFQMRRKTLVNNLSGYRDLTRQRTLELLGQARLAADIRAEQLSIEDFDRLAFLIEQDASDPRHHPPNP
ncbi:MAG: 16S rRNA (adenine(1518)-N(6)/adenine(1519)-N(6))-dimethyltransferase RsmA [Acidobacteriota bacterium]